MDSRVLISSGKLDLRKAKDSEPLHVVYITAPSTPFSKRLRNMSMVQRGDPLSSNSLAFKLVETLSGSSMSHHRCDISRQAKPQSQLCFCPTWMRSYSPMKSTLSSFVAPPKLNNQFDTDPINEIIATWTFLDKTSYSQMERAPAHAKVTTGEKQRVLPFHQVNRVLHCFSLKYSSCNSNTSQNFCQTGS